MTFTSNRMWLWQKEESATFQLISFALPAPLVWFLAFSFCPVVAGIPPIERH